MRLLSCGDQDIILDNLNTYYDVNLQLIPGVEV